MEVRCGSFLFTSKFDSGNLARVERVERNDEDGAAPPISSNGEPRPDYEFNVWTKPDCGETEFENPNRSWFYFGIKGYPSNRLLKINIMNMNRQGKLYNQGFSPFVRVQWPGRPGRWDRVRDKATFEIVESQFKLSFTYRFPDQRGGMVQFAFCYPWSYEECQLRLAELDIKYEHCSSLNPESPEDSLYYHRELLCYSLTRLRVDLITITDCHGMSEKREPRFDPKLFPDDGEERCKRFHGKRVYVLTSRVHPGETPGSHVFNGFLDFILREDDPRAKALRRQYVFKLIPLLNPDGVIQGHYRTDTRGVNLNRVYLDPDPSLYPTIYAAKSVLVYYHVHYRVRKTKPENVKDQNMMPSDTSLTNDSLQSESTDDNDRNNERNGEAAVEEIYGKFEHESVVNDSNSVKSAASSDKTEKKVTTFRSNFARFDIELNGKMKYFRRASQKELVYDLESDSDLNKTDNRTALSSGCLGNGVHDDDSDCDSETDHLGNEGSDDEGDFTPAMNGAFRTPHLNDPQLLQIPAARSGVAFYVDLHGHASKRGCFIYGNFLDSEEQMVDCLLYPKLISMNTAHFDFGACNFSLKNMYTKDKRDGMTKEGSGRVAIYKSIGIVRSYTLECNYNMGRMVNCVPPAVGDNGRATPPPLAGFPPKYTIAHYEEVGRACAVAALDVTESNPWSRISASEYYSLSGVREWVRRYYRSFKGSPAKGNRVVPRVPVQKPPVNHSSQTGLSRPRLSLVDTSVTSTSSLNGGRRPPPARRDSLQTTYQRRESTAVVINRTTNQRRASETDQSQRSPMKRHAPRVTTPPQKEVCKPTARKEPVCISFSKRGSDGKIETSSNGNNGFRSISNRRQDRRRTLPACPTADKVPPTQALLERVPPSQPPLADFDQTLESPDKPHERHSNMKFHTDENIPKGRQGLLTQGPSSLFEEEEKKIQQLKDFCSGAGVTKPRLTSQVVLSKPLEAPKSDPLKRKVIRRLPGKRRSNSYSPKSAKGLRSWNSSGTDSDAEKRRSFKKKKNLRKPLKEGSEDTEDEKNGLHSVGITGIKLSPRPAIQSDITLQQINNFFMEKLDGQTSPNREPDKLYTGLSQLSLLNRRNSSPEKKCLQDQWIDSLP